VSLLSAGISQGVQGFAPLDNVPAELSAVTAIFPGESLLDEQFAVARFTSELGGRPFGIVHVASHGEFTADISQSFLLAWDGKIAMTELASLVGATRFRTQPLELLTLSACETAAGDDRAALGLAGVAVRAGARSALATLWAVTTRRPRTCSPSSTSSSPTRACRARRRCSARSSPCCTPTAGGTRATGRRTS
jgi:CHAT domain-containing protein